jgi:hypothetical protein
MSRVSMRAGIAIASYVDDGLGRRLLVAREGKYGAQESPVVIAMNQREAKAVISTLIQLMEELPP